MTVGPVLAKAVAETVVAQPSNPQEYLALYLLHHIQQEEAREGEVAKQKEKAEVLRQEWNKNRLREEKVAVDVIQGAFRTFKGRLAAKKAREAELWEAYEEAADEAEDFLEQLGEAETKGPGDEEGGGSAQGRGEEEEDGEGGAAPDEATLEDLQESMDEAKIKFYRAQRFLLQISKSDFGVLKNLLLEKKESIRVGQDAVQAVLDVTRLEEEAILDRLYDTPPNRLANFSAAALEVADRLAARRDHSRISAPYILFGVLRSICYLLFNRTPKEVETPAKVAHVLKPTVVVQLLRAFDPCATYDKSRPLDLEKRLQRKEDDDEDEDEESSRGKEKDKGGRGGRGREEEMDEDAEGWESIPVPQPKPRQVRRVQRLLRTLLLHQEYVCEVDPTPYFEDYLDRAEDDAENVIELKKEVKTAEEDRARAEKIRTAVENHVKTRGGVVLYALLEVLNRAVGYRIARDLWARRCRDKGVEVPDRIELGEDEEEDEQNEEVLFDDDGEIDATAVKRLVEKIGQDVDEQLGILWEAKDARKKKDLAGRSEGLQKTVEEEEGDNEEEDVE